MQDNVSAAYRVSFSAARKDERPPQTFVRMTFKQGTIEVGSDYEMTVTLLERKPGQGIARTISTIQALPDSAEWTRDPALVDYRSWIGQWEPSLPTNRACAEYVIDGNRDAGTASSATTGEDNLNVLATMYGAYLAFKEDSRIEIPDTIAGLERLARRLDAARIGYPDFPAAEPEVAPTAE
jgi:hypothetical protein